MALLETYGAQRQSRTFDCPKYVAAATGKRCRHYVKGGACALADEFMCIEWLKANGHTMPVNHPARGETQTDLFGSPTPASKLSSRKSKAPRTPATAAAARPVPVPSLRDQDGPAHTLPLVTKEDVESFKALGVEVCVTSEELGAMWLVPEYRDASRQEISIEHAATLCCVVGAFPGAKVTAFEKHKPTNASAAESTT